MTSTQSQQLVEVTQHVHPKRTFEEIVLKEYWDFRDVFSKESFDE
jgi:hypothetical protein